MRTKLNRLVGLCLLAALLGLANLAAAGNISGHVKRDDGAGVTDVVISAEWRGSGRRELSRTDVSGGFRVDTPADLGATKTLTLFFEKPGYRSETRSLRMSSSGSPLPDKLEIELSPDNQPPSTKDFQALAPAISHEGRTLFLIPYALDGENSTEISERLNQKLPDDIKYGILTRLSSVYRKAISIGRVEAHIDAANTEKVRSLGKYLNALAVVTGRGALRSDAAKAKILDITSEFILPAGSGSTVLNDSYYVDDLIPETDLSDPHLGKALNEKWAHRTLLALADKEIRDGNTDPAIIVGYLTAAKHIAGNEEEKRELDEMISIAKKAQQ